MVTELTQPDYPGRFRCRRGRCRGRPMTQDPVGRTARLPNCLSAAPSPHWAIGTQNNFFGKCQNYGFPLRKKPDFT